MTGSVGPDGYVRSAAEERKLNKLIDQIRRQMGLDIRVR